jgi:hypothetical protein
MAEYPNLNTPVDGDWRTQRLDDGRIVEFLDARWAQDDGSEPAGTIPVAVTVAVDGEVRTHRVLLTSEQIERGFR